MKQIRNFASNFEISGVEHIEHYTYIIMSFFLLGEHKYYFYKIVFRMMVEAENGGKLLFDFLILKVIENWVKAKIFAEYEME